MDRQIVLDVNLGFGNDYDQLSVPTSNTILSFLNRKIQARAQKKQAHVSAAAASELPVATESVPSARGHDEIIACGPSSSSSCSEDGGARRSQDSTKTVTFQAGKLHEISLLSAISTSDDEDNIVPIQVRKNEETQLVKTSQNSDCANRSSAKRNSASSGSNSNNNNAVPTFRFLNYRTTEENWVMYTIEITNGTDKWRFESRYSLLKIFEEKLAEEVKGQKMPEFPGKKWFGNLSDEFIKDRMISIERFMNAAFRNNNVQKTKIFKEFLRQSRENCIDF